MGLVWQLYPRVGRLNPAGLKMLSDCSDYEEVVRVAEYYAEYRSMFDAGQATPGEKTLEDKFFEYEVGGHMHLAQSPSLSPREHTQTQTERERPTDIHTQTHTHRQTHTHTHRQTHTHTQTDKQTHRQTDTEN